MKKNSLLRKALKKSGREPSWLIKEIGINAQILNNWFERGVPANRVIETSNALELMPEDIGGKRYRLSADIIHNANQLKAIEVNRGTNKNPIPNALYCVYTRNGRGKSIGNILLGAECNWFSSEIVGWSLLPVYEQEVIDLFN